MTVTNFNKLLALSLAIVFLSSCASVAHKIKTDADEEIWSDIFDPDHRVVGDWPPGYDPNVPTPEEKPDRPY